MSRSNDPSPETSSEPSAGRPVRRSVFRRLSTRLQLFRRALRRIWASPAGEPQLSPPAPRVVEPEPPAVEDTSDENTEELEGPPVINMARIKLSLPPPNLRVAPPPEPEPEPDYEEEEEEEPPGSNEPLRIFVGLPRAAP